MAEVHDDLAGGLTRAADVQVRPGHAHDLPALARVHRRAREVAAMPSAEGDVEAWVRTWDLDEDDLWVAEVDGEPAAYARMRGAWLDDLYVLPEHQGRGIGTLLLDVVCSLRPQGFGLWVFASNAAARRFYAGRGLVELEQTDGSGNAEHAPDVRLVWPGERPLRFLREAIDGVDDELALLLARRVALAGAVQDLKAAGGGPAGLEGRDPDREAQIVRRMAAQAPGLDPARLARIVHVVLEEGLAAWHERTGAG